MVNTTKLKELKVLLDSGALTQEEYQALKSKVIEAADGDAVPLPAHSRPVSDCGLDLSTSLSSAQLRASSGSGGGMATTGPYDAATAPKVASMRASASSVDSGSDTVRLSTGGWATIAPPAPLSKPHSLLSERVSRARASNRSVESLVQRRSSCQSNSQVASPACNSQRASQVSDTQQSQAGGAGCTTWCSSMCCQLSSLAIASVLLLVSSTMLALQTGRCVAAFGQGPCAPWSSVPFMTHPQFESGVEVAVKESGERRNGLSTLWYVIIGSSSGIALLVGLVLLWCRCHRARKVEPEIAVAKSDLRSESQRGPSISSAQRMQIISEHRGCICCQLVALVLVLVLLMAATTLLALQTGKCMVLFGWGPCLPWSLAPFGVVANPAPVTPPCSTGPFFLARDAHVGDLAIALDLLPCGIEAGDTLTLGSEVLVVGDAQRRLRCLLRCEPHPLYGVPFVHRRQATVRLQSASHRPTRCE